jgi:nickel-type superoxide dismutase maturation protease
MVPELRDGDEVLVDGRAYRRSPPKPGDVVLVSHPTQAGTRILKRVDGVRDGGLWLLGDNAGESTDSRHFGAVDPSRVLGRVVARF